MSKSMKKKALVSSILTIALCFSVIAGSTLALFTSKSEVNIAVTSGKVNLEAYIDETSLETSSLGVAQDAGKFAVGGTASFNDETADLVLDKIVPGDKATFKINVKNNSNVDIMYKIAWTVDNTALDALVVTSDGKALADLGWTEWKAADAGTNKVLPVEIELPMEVSDEKYQDQTANVTFTVEAVQANAVTESVATEEQLLAALATGATQLTLTDSINLSNTLVLDKETELTLVLNGNTITNANGVALQNDGKLTVVDSAIMTLSADAEAKVGGIKGTSMDASARNAIVNNGTMTITGGKYESAATYAINNAGTMTVNDITTDGGIYNSGELVINNSTVVNKVSGRHAVYHEGTALTINGGSSDNHSGNEVVRANAANVVINDGTFTMTGKSYLMGSSANGNIIVNGGTFNGYVNENGTNDAMRPGCAVVNGGTFNFDPTSWIASEYVEATVNDANTVWTVGAKVEDGEDPEDPSIVLLGTVEKLETFADEVNAGETYSGKTIVLTNDLDLAGVDWTPIGNATNNFQGTFDGQNNTISNLVVNGGTNSNQGLFGMTTNGTVKNIKIHNAKVSGRLNVGVLAGTPYTAKYENITLTGHVEVNGMAYVGGLFGKNTYANVNNVTIDVDDTSYVKADSVENGTAYRTYVGGVIGFMGEGGHKVSNVTSNIDVYGSTIDIGGITGIAHYGNVFEYCKATGDVYCADANENEYGGIAGVWHNQNGTTVTFNHCEFTGKIYVDNKEVASTIVNAPYSSTGTGKLYIDGALVTEDVADIDDVLLGGGDVVLTDDLKVNSTETKANSGYGATGVSVDGGVLDGNGNTLTVSNAWGTWDCAIDVSNGTIKNLTINSGMRGIFVTGNTDKVIIDNVTVDGSVYTISCDEGANGGLEATDSTFNGWTSYAATIGNVKFTKCSFGEGSGYAFCRPYAPTEFVGCDFEAGFVMDARAAVTFENCTIGGVALTAENLSTLVVYNTANASVK